MIYYAADESPARPQVGRRGTRRISEGGRRPFQGYYRIALFM